MKHSLIAALLITTISTLTVVSCTKPSSDTDSTAEQTEYYVRYASDGLAGTGILVYNVSYTDETGKKQSFSDMTADSFERVIGPVSVGFEASLRISVANYNDTRTRAARIEVKKGNGPFVVKVEKSGKGYSGVSVSYTIE